MAENKNFRSPYAGRWVALIRGQIVAQGETVEQVLFAAKNFRYKEVPEIKFMSNFSDEILVFINTVRNSLTADNSAYLVGGAVRDILLNRPIHDLDFSVARDGLSLAKVVSNKLENSAFYPMDIKTDTGRVIVSLPTGKSQTLDFAGFRAATLEEDLRDRDFTINAIAMKLDTETLIDPLGGAKDLREKRLRACSEQSFSNDPVRILRAVRLAAAYGLTIESQTRKGMKESVSLLLNCSVERLRDEFFKILAGPKPETALRALSLLGVFEVFLPELQKMKDVSQSAPHVYDVWTHTLAVLRHMNDILAALAPEYSEERANADLFTGLLVLRLGRFREQIGKHYQTSLNPNRSMYSLLMMACLYHDVAKPETRTVEKNGRIRFLGHAEKGAHVVLQRGINLHCSNAEIDRLRDIVQYHMRIHDFVYRLIHQNEQPSKRAIYRFFRDTGSAGVDLVLLSLADTWATYEQTLNQEHWTACLDVCRLLLEAWYETPEIAVSPPSLLDGNELIKAINLKPGKVLGKMIEAIREAQAEGIVTTKEQALDYARRWLAEQN